MCLKNEEKQKSHFLLFAGQDASMPRAHGCAGAAVLKKTMDGLFQHAIGEKDSSKSVNVARSVISLAPDIVAARRVL
jgi:hypothetical protein